MDNKVLFGIMCIVFNSYGVPCFMQGKTKAGIMRIVLGVVTFGIIALINAIKGIILGVQVLNMTDEEYEAQKGNIDSGIPAAK
jgi:TM2 domain-containing membrane protein YozV